MHLSILPNVHPTLLLLASYLAVGLLLVLFHLIQRWYRRFRRPTIVAIRLNNGRTLCVPRGDTLLEGMRAGGVYLPSGCGGIGICGQCRCTLSPAGKAGHSEKTLLTAAELYTGTRFACQARIKRPLTVTIPKPYLTANTFHCRVTAINRPTPFIKELTLVTKDGRCLSAQSGDSILVHIPAHELEYDQLPVPAALQAQWRAAGADMYRSRVLNPLIVGYSIANYPPTELNLQLLVNLKIPATAVTTMVDKRVLSQAAAWLFALRKGDEVHCSGPIATFPLVSGGTELVFIGAGTGIAPLRSHILAICREQPDRPQSLWFAARTVAELYYHEEMRQLAANHASFHYHPVIVPGRDSITEPAERRKELHTLLHTEYLLTHPAPETIQFYICAPPLMTRQVLEMLAGLGIPLHHIHRDSVGQQQQEPVDTAGSHAVTGPTPLHTDCTVPWLEPYL